MKLLAIFAALLICSSPLHAQTMKSLMFNSTNGQVVANTETNTLRFTNDISFQDGPYIYGSGIAWGNASGGGINLEEGIVTDPSNSTVFTWSDGNTVSFSRPITFASTTNAAATRTNLGLGNILTITNTGVYITTNLVATNGAASFTNLNTRYLELNDWLYIDTTNTSVVQFIDATVKSNFQHSIGLGATNNVKFNEIEVGGTGSAKVTSTGVNGGAFNGQINFEENLLFTDDGAWDFQGSGIDSLGALSFNNTTNSAITRTNLGLGASNIVTFAGITNNGDITINQTSTNNGLLYIRRTNNEPFLGVANLIASNNTTLSNETLFRVGIAEATNKSAQFGFRTVRTNNGGEGFAVFSVFGYNALMMIGPSDRSRTNYATNTNAGVEADIWTISPTNRVLTLRDTNNGALMFHQEIGWSSGSVTTNAPANTTNVATWLEVWIGTNAYRLPLYQ